MTQKGIFDKDEIVEWEQEWQGMPEFSQPNLKPFQSITVHFETEEDRKEFEKLLQRTLTDKTKWIYFPQNRKIKSNYKYINES